MLNAGDLVFIYWHQAKKEKFLICIDPEQLLFMVINSEPWIMKDAQIAVTPAQIPYLTNGESILSIRPRLSELKELHAVSTTGTRRRNKSGHSADVLEAIE